MLKYSWVPNSRKAERRFEFHKSRQLFIRSHNDTFSVAAMCVCNSRLFARWNQGLIGSPNSNRLS